MQIFHNDVAFILQHEAEIAPNFLDDIAVLGPRTRYEQEGGGFEVLVENPKIRCFVWGGGDIDVQHMDGNRISGFKQSLGHQKRHGGKDC